MSAIGFDGHHIIQNRCPREIHRVLSSRRRPGPMGEMDTGFRRYEGDGVPGVAWILRRLSSGRSACVHDGNVNSMGATPLIVRSSASASLLERARLTSPTLLVPAGQLLPSLSFLAIFFALPAVTLI